MAITKEMIAEGLKDFTKKKVESVSSDGTFLIVGTQKIEILPIFFTKEKITAIKARAKRSHTADRTDSDVVYDWVLHAIVGIATYLKAKKGKTPVVKTPVKKVVKKTKGKIVFPEFKKKPNDLVYSYSKRNKFIDSPRDYFYSYLMKMDKDTYGIQSKKRKSAFFIGGVFHDLLEVFYTSQQLGFTQQQAYKMANVDFEINWPESKKQEIEGITYTAGKGKTERNYLMDLEDAKSYFDNYYNHYKGRDFDEVIYAEVSFMSELYEYDDKDLEGYHFFQHIKADLFVKDKGVYKLVEHKTHSSDRTVAQRVSPQTLEYVEGIKKELGIDVQYIVFNEIRKVAPKAFTLLKSGKVSTAKNKITNFSRLALDRQLADGIIDEGTYQDGLQCVNEDYYFHREEIRVNPVAQRNFSLEMKLSTKNLARALVSEKIAQDKGEEINILNYPINWSANRQYRSEFEEIYIAFFQGMDIDSINNILFEKFEPKDLSYQNAPSETPIEKINRLAELI